METPTDTSAGPLTDTLTGALTDTLTAALTNSLTPALTDSLTATLTGIAAASVTPAVIQTATQVFSSPAASVTGAAFTPTAAAHPAYPTVPSFPTTLQWIGAYMIIHVGSVATRRWGYILWFAIAGIFMLVSLFHAFGWRGGALGAYWQKWALRRRTLRNRFTRGKPVILMPNAQMLTLGFLTVATVALAFIGPDYIAPAKGAFEFRRRAYVDPALAKPFQPQYDIDKAWWTSGNRTGILAFALLPLCILFALKAPPFAIFAIPHLVQLHFDKLSWLHRWSGRLIWFITFLHVLFWVIQLGTERQPETGRLALYYAFEYDKFIYAWIVCLILLTVYFLLINVL